jgi:hypothetical protein
MGMNRRAARDTNLLLSNVARNVVEGRLVTDRL